MTDTYRNFAHLDDNEIEGEDYEIELLTVGRDDEIVVMAPHGDGIEPYTAELAREIAGDDLAFYAFKGIKQSGGNGVLHITSTRFDEPDADRLARNAHVVFTVHGKDGPGEFAMVGGGHRQLVEDLESVLIGLGIEVRPPTPDVAAVSVGNLCNRCREGGAQVELSRALRKRLTASPVERTAFVKAVRGSIRRHAQETEH